MKLDHYFFYVSKSREDQKRSSPRLEEFFSPKSSEDQKKSPKIIQRSNADHSQIIGRDSQTIKGDIISPGQCRRQSKRSEGALAGSWGGTKIN